MQALIINARTLAPTHGRNPNRARYGLGISDLPTLLKLFLCLTAVIMNIGVPLNGFTVPRFTVSSIRVCLGLGDGSLIGIGPSTWPLCNGITISISRLSAFGVGLGRAWAWGAESSKVPGARVAVSRGQSKVLGRLVSMDRSEFGLGVSLKILHTKIQIKPLIIRVSWSETEAPSQMLDFSTLHMSLSDLDRL